MTLDPMPVIQPGDDRPSWSIPVTFDWLKQHRAGVNGVIVGRCIGADSVDILVDGGTEIAGDISKRDWRPRVPLALAKGEW